MDQIGLHAMAMVDPELHPQFAALAAPVEASARPVVLDNNAKARKRTPAETVMNRRAQYTNSIVDLAVGQFGCVFKHPQDLCWGIVPSVKDQ